MYEGSTLHFDGSEWIKFQRTCEISNTFTYEFWVKAEEEQILDEERNTGTDGIGGRKFWWDRISTRWELRAAESPWVRTESRCSNIA